MRFMDKKHSGGDVGRDWVIVSFSGSTAVHIRQGAYLRDYGARCFAQVHVPTEQRENAFGEVGTKVPWNQVYRTTWNVE